MERRWEKKIVVVLLMTLSIQSCKLVTDMLGSCNKPKGTYKVECVELSELPIDIRQKTIKVICDYVKTKQEEGNPVRSYNKKTPLRYIDFGVFNTDKDVRIVSSEFINEICLGNEYMPSADWCAYYNYKGVILLFRKSYVRCYDMKLYSNNIDTIEVLVGFGKEVYHIYDSIGNVTKTGDNFFCVE